MTEREKIEKLRNSLVTVKEVLKVLGDFPLLVTELELTLDATAPAEPRRTHGERWKEHPQR